MRDERRSNAFFREADMTMRAARTHLGTVGRQPAYVEAFAHAHLRQQLAEQQHALPAEACNLDGVIAEVVRMVGDFAEGSLVFRADFEHIRNGALRRNRALGSFGLAIAKHIQWEYRD